MFPYIPTPSPTIQGDTTSEKDEILKKLQIPSMVSEISIESLSGRPAPRDYLKGI